MRRRMYACLCLGLTEAQVREVGRAGTMTASALIELLRLEDPKCCGRCARQVDTFVTLAWEGATQSQARPLGAAPTQTLPSFA